MNPLPATALISGLLFSASAFSSPWIDTSDVYLRDDIQLLADAGIITVPVTTYPLMWTGIGLDLQDIAMDSLDARLRLPFMRVQHYYQKARSNDGYRQHKIGLANATRRFPGFGHQAGETAEIVSGAEYVGKRFAAKLSLQYSADDDDNRFQHQQALTADGSYVAVAVGNWSLRAGAVSQWWGPGWDNSLILSDNMRPLPAISLTRNDSSAFQSPWLSWIGPWTFTTQMAQLETSRSVPNTKLWSSRGTFRPIPSLEVGASWSVMWGGEGQPNSLSDFYKAITGQTECVNGAAQCAPMFETKRGNHLAGFDLRWSGELLGHPLAAYAQTIGEDAVGIRPTDKAYLFGVESSLYRDDNHYRIFAEYQDTEVDCRRVTVGEFDCFYEHDQTYFSGYRYKGRTIGSSFDNDSVGWTLGLLSQQSNHHSWQAKVRWLQLNTNNRDFHPDDPQLGHTVTKVAKDLLQLDLSYRYSLWKGMLTLGGDISRFTLKDDNSHDTDVNVFASWEYRY